jgi:hypothetical protein
MCVRVDFCNRDNAGRTVSIGGQGGGGWLGTPWRLNLDSAIALTRQPGWIFYTEDARSGRRALVTPDRNGTFLTTTGDGTTQNNLDLLPSGNRDLAEMEPAFPERPYIRVPQLVSVLRGNMPSQPLRGGSYPVQPAPNIGVRFAAPWPAALTVKVNFDREPLREVPRFEPQQPGLEYEGWYYIDDVSVPGGSTSEVWTIRVVPPRGLRHSAVRITIVERALAPRCQPNPNTDGPALQQRLADAFQTLPLRVNVGRTQPHPPLADLSASERTELAAAIRGFLAEPGVLTQHFSLDHLTTVVDEHRLYVSMLEDFLWRNGFGPRYVPLPYWDPTQPIPVEFQAVVGGFAAITDPNPRINLPSELRSPALCALATIQDLWSAMRAWHNAVHAGVGGAMTTLAKNAPAALIFWPWHAYVDNIYLQWELCGP